MPAGHRFAAARRRCAPRPQAFGTAGDERLEVIRSQEQRPQGIGYRAGSAGSGRSAGLEDGRVVQAVDPKEIPSTRKDAYTYPYTHGARSPGSSTPGSSSPTAHAMNSPVPISPTGVITTHPVQAKPRSVRRPTAPPSRCTSARRMAAARAASATVPHEAIIHFGLESSSCHTGVPLIPSVPPAPRSPSASRTRSPPPPRGTRGSCWTPRAVSLAELTLGHSWRPICPTSRAFSIRPPACSWAVTPRSGCGTRCATRTSGCPARRRAGASRTTFLLRHLRRP